MRSPLFSRFVLIFALLLAQLGGLTHGISHALAEQERSSEHALPHDKHCDLCVAYSQISSAIGSSSISFAGSEHFETLYLSDSSSYLSSTFVAFAARAPPYST